MIARTRRLLTFSNVIACLALFIALGGTVYAAGILLKAGLLGVIIDARDRQQAAGGDFLISRPSRQVVRVLEIAGSRAELPIAAE